MARPRLHDDQTERALLAAAETLLAAEGVEALSARRLADAAGTSVRAIYSVFGGMDGVVQALFRQAFQALSADLDALPRTDDAVRDLVDAGALGFRGWALARPHLFRLAFSLTPPEVTPADSALGVEAFERLVARVRRCVDGGGLPAGREAEIALSFHALCEGLATLELRGRFPMPGGDATKAWRGALSALVAGYR